MYMLLCSNTSVTCKYWILSSGTWLAQLATGLIYAGAVPA
jgi:hypothetical protein